MLKKTKTKSEADRLREENELLRAELLDYRDSERRREEVHASQLGVNNALMALLGDARGALNSYEACQVAQARGLEGLAALGPAIVDALRGKPAEAPKTTTEA